MLKAISIVTCIMGLGLLGFASYWYLYLWPDRSQFAAFGAIGLLLIYFALVLWEMGNNSYRIDRIEKIIEYFEDNLIKEPDIEKLPIDKAMQSVREKVKKNWDSKVDVYIKNNVKTKQDARNLIKALNKVVKNEEIYKM